MLFQNLAFILPSFQQFFLKRMLLVSCKVVCVENEALLLCLTMRERASAFAATIQCVTFLYSFCHYKVQFLWCTFQMHFGMGTRHFQKVVFRMKLFSPCNLSFAIQLIQGCENLFSLMSLSKSKFLTRVALVSFVQHSCRFCVALVSLVSHSCCTRVVCVALLSFVSLVSGTRVIKQTRPMDLWFVIFDYCQQKYTEYHFREKL